MVRIEPELTATLVVIALVAIVALVAVCALLMVRQAALRRQLRQVFADTDQSVLDVLVAQGNSVETLREDLASVHGNTERLRASLGEMISRIGMVRYDAFDDVAGAQSFSAALLDRDGNGLVISAINGRHETRCYGKEVVGGASEHTLSNEESEAIRSAMEGRPVATLARPPRRRRRAS